MIHFKDNDNFSYNDSLIENLIIGIRVISNMFVLKTKIPCENCANSIKNTLKNIVEIEKVACSVEKSEIIVYCRHGADETKVRGICVDELKKTGRTCQ